MNKRDAKLLASCIKFLIKKELYFITFFDFRIELVCVSIFILNGTDHDVNYINL